jgi:hypothetical protein
MFPSIAQAPAPLQVPLSRAQAHAVPEPGKEHCAALPSQAPAQTPLPAQGPRCPCGAACDGIGQQVPMCPDTSQAWHCPVQAWSQQTPSVQ